MRITWTADAISVTGLANMFRGHDPQRVPFTSYRAADVCELDAKPSRSSHGFGCFCSADVVQITPSACFKCPDVDRRNTSGRTKTWLGCALLVTHVFKIFMKLHARYKLISQSSLVFGQACGTVTTMGIAEVPCLMRKCWYMLP